MPESPTNSCPTCPHNWDWHDETGCTISYCHCKTPKESSVEYNCGNAMLIFPKQAGSVCSTPMKTILMLLLTVTAVYSQDVKTSYDKFKDRTQVVFTKGRAVDDDRKSYWLWVAAGFSYPGTTLKEPADSFLVQFTSSSGSWRFLKSHNLILLADGKSYDLGAGKHDGDIRSSRWVTVSETISYAFNREQIEAIANAKKVELQLGGFEGYFDDKTLAKFKELLAASKP